MGVSVRLYIAGPMTGLPEHNVPAFNRAEQVLKSLGFRVLNPARHEGRCADWVGYMRLGLKDVCDSDGVALLPGWQNSQGANLEKATAEALQLPVRPIEEWLWIELPTDEAATKVVVG